MSTHPIKPGTYWIRYQGDLTVIQSVYADPKLDLPVVHTGGDIDFNRGIWYLEPAESGYKIRNFRTGEYVYVPCFVEGEVVQLTSDEEKATIWNIQGDGDEIYRLTAPEHDLYWTNTTGGIIKLVGSDGKPDQMFSFQIFIGP